MERDIQLQRANDERTAANEQLTAIEEELRHQYEELDRICKQGRSGSHASTKMARSLLSLGRVS